MVIAVDTGNKQIKTRSFAFPAGLTEKSSAPTGVSSDEYVRFRGNYYVPTEVRGAYERDKTENDKYFILALIGIVKELDKRCDESLVQYDRDNIYNITLLVGLPPAHVEDKELRNDFRKYFRMSSPERVVYKNKSWNICIKSVKMNVQCFAAAMTIYDKIKDVPNAFIIDIGGFTADYVMARDGSFAVEDVDSMENGLILMYRTVMRKCRNKLDRNIKEMDVDYILSGKTEYYDDAVVDLVREEARRFTENFLKSFREIGYDLKSMYVVFTGGGSLLLKEFIKSSGLVNKYTFIESVNANALGYEMYFAGQHK